jgi:hypothetical protein
MKTRLTMLFLAFGLALAAGEPEGAKPDTDAQREERGRKIMEKNREQMTAREFASKATLLLIDASERVQTRHLRRLSKTGDDDYEKYLIIFSDPPEIRGTAVLNIEHQDRDDDLWIYLPALKKSKRISGTNLRGSWMGTEFSYKDLKRDRVAENRYLFVRVEPKAAPAVPPAAAAGGKGGAEATGAKAPEAGAVDLFVLDAFPATQREKDEQGYSRRRLWIRADNYYVAKAEFYDKDGELLKTLSLADLRPIGRTGKVRAFTNTMISQKGLKSVIKFEEIHID